jgi:hypothetical protein
VFAASKTNLKPQIIRPMGKKSSGIIKGRKFDADFRKQRLDQASLIRAQAFALASSK